MSGVIPRPTVLGPARGTLDTSGLWRVRALDPSLASVARTVEGLLRPHLSRRGGAASEITLALADTAEVEPPLGGVAVRRRVV
ncbi:hypothetical protein AB0J35_55300 [Nonomuraea angiospora]|uniref:hypothetical protein n=1 Tax=Nonomuraea angiospora TaxID=46172 RepID=UPI003414B0C2